ncbi:putative SOS response-associated peptidase YedK [Sediminihabitans luteus]|uniref:Abasic site processing protein n=1 Tax=Sediminihabitans luteus TaxID=1138585 RepID=A0A2M9CYC6_9CELL|nr:SOS response-associated peptidase [Sediminihabitans luteus]PJJ76936.1 putative SOS response-associated peptidase YedK [Sediminihabitans luteus]GII99577.1 DUF159 family protein [Sediminihabitans luteus]
MCGRYASFTSDQDLADEFAIAEIADDARLLGPSWNVAPTDPVRIVVERAPRGSADAAPVRSLQVARWGLVPSWAKDPGVGPRMINARAETLLDKAAFAKPLAARRCLVPADGYYEWQKLPGPGRQRKQPWFIRAASGPTAFAGLYEFWRDRSRADDDPERWLVSTTIVTTAAPSGATVADGTELAAIHDRTPAVLPRDVWDAWLDPATSADEAHALVARHADRLVAHRVAAGVGNVANDSPANVEPVDVEPVDVEPVDPAAGQPA